MSNIRTQAIISGFILYFGFAIGAINIYLYTKEGTPFSEEAFGLTRLFFDLAQNIFAIGSIGIIAVMYKFFPYYRDNLPKHKNDLLTWSLCTACIGFFAVLLIGIVFKQNVIEYFNKKNSQLFIQYYYYIFPFGFGMLLFSVMEGYGWLLKKTVATNFLKETALRIITTVFIALFYLNLISFNSFIYLFSSLYFIIFIALLIYLYQQKELYFTFSISHVTKKFWKKIVSMQMLIYSGTIITALRQTIDGILITTIIGLSATGIFTLAQYVANLVQVPQRSLQSISVAPLSQAWKDKNLKEIHRIYARSCINMLIAALFIYGNAVLNMADAIELFGIKATYLQGIHAMIVLGLVWIIDAGTGVNGMVILTSSKWRFDFFSGMIMIVMVIPLNYFLIKQFGLIGSAYAQLISFAIYNFIRFEFIRRTFNMQPFTLKNVYTILLFIVAFIIANLTGMVVHGWMGLFLKSIIFSGLMIGGVVLFKLTPDATQLLNKQLTKWKKTKS